MKPTKLAKGTVVNGEQMYVEYFVPAQVRHPFSIVSGPRRRRPGPRLADDAGRPPGWAHYFVQQGYKVYVVDRPGHGRSPFHPDLHGAFPARAVTYDNVARQFTAPEKAPMPYGPEAARHNQWPGTGVLGDAVTDQVIAGQGGSFVADLERTHRVWAERAGELLDTNWTRGGDDALGRRPVCVDRRERAAESRRRPAAGRACRSAVWKSEMGNRRESARQYIRRRQILPI